MHVNAIDGVDCVDPSSPLVHADGNGLGNGWANNPQIEAQIAAWYNATSLDEEKTIYASSIGWPCIMASTHR